MNSLQLSEALQSMAAMDGMEGCALVDAETGMAWQSAGHIEHVALVAEAASDYWRLYQRSRQHFQHLGALRAQVLMHAGGRITIVACGPGTLLVLLTPDQDRLDWQAWKDKTKALQALVAGF